MALLPIPVARELTPMPALTPPEGFVVVDEPLVDGLPHRVSLDADHVAVLAVPSGLATAWLHADPTEAVSLSADTLTPWLATGDLSIGGVDRAPARLFVLRGGEVCGSLPLVVGRLVRVRDDGLAPGVSLEIVVLAWQIRAGTVRGPGDAGARISLAWRRADVARDTFAVPTVHPRVLVRQLATAAGSS